MIAIENGKPATSGDPRHRELASGLPGVLGRVGTLRRCLVMQGLTRSRANELDALIASGDEDSAPELCAVRARQLASRRCRQAVAAQIEMCVEMATPEACAPRGPTSVWLVDLRAAEVHSARSDLIELAALLRRTEPVHARAVALALRLARDSGSPLYVPHSRNDVADAVKAAKAAVAGQAGPSADALA